MQWMDQIEIVIGDFCDYDTIKKKIGYPYLKETYTDLCFNSYVISYFLIYQVLSTN